MGSVIRHDLTLAIWQFLKEHPGAEYTAVEIAREIGVSTKKNSHVHSSLRSIQNADKKLKSIRISDFRLKWIYGVKPITPLQVNGSDIIATVLQDVPLKDLVSALRDIAAAIRQQTDTMVNEGVVMR